MESFKQEMLHHEFIFRNQVRELHRLYWTQKNLMNEFRLGRIESHGRSRSSLVAPTGSKESEDMGRAFLVSCQAIEMRNSPPWNVGTFGEFKGKTVNLLKNHEKAFSLHLPAEDFVRGKGKGLDFCHPGVSDFNIMDGSLGEITMENNIHHSGTKREKFIELDDSVELECHEETDVVFSVGFRTPMLIEEQSVIGLDEENGGRLQEQKPVLSYAGLEDSRAANPVNQARENQLHKPLLFDLNVPLEHVEESDSCPVKPSRQNRDDGSLDSNPAFHNTNDSDDIKNSTEVAYACQMQAEGSEKPMDGSTGSISLSKVGKGNLDSLPDIDFKGQDSNLTSSNSTNLLQTAVNRDVITKPGIHEGSEEDTSSSQEPRPPPYACSRKDMCKSMERSADDSITTQLSSPRNEVSYIGTFKPEEHDGTGSTAAEILMAMSSRCSTIPVNQPDGVTVLEPESDEADNLPQYSSDSFEYMTLQLSVVQGEDHGRMPEQSSLSETGKNGRGHRLRRGRGFRDFQKEILPGLLTLSRHEVREDLQYMGYERRRVVFTNARDNWLAPVARSRRTKPKLPCGRRRR